MSVYKHADDAVRRERRQHAWKLRLQGKSLREIGQELGLGLATVHRMIHEHDEELREREIEAAQQYRQLQHARLEAMVRAFWNDALAGDPRAAAVLLRVLDVENRLLGLCLPPGTSMLHGSQALPDLPDWSHGV